MSSEKMTSRERLTAARLSQPVDRVPIRIWGATPWTEAWHPSFKPILEAALAHTDIVAGWRYRVGLFFSDAPELKPKVIERPSRHEDYLEQESIYETPYGTLRQVKLISPANKPEIVTEFMIRTEEDALAWLSAPYVPPRPDTSDFLTMDRSLGAGGIVSVSIGREPLHLIHELMGSETLALWSIEKRDLLREMLDVALERAIAYVTYLLDQGLGPHFGYVGPEVAIPPLMGPRDFREFVVDVDKQINRVIRQAGGIVWVHCHGRVGAVLEGFVEMGTHCLNPMEPPPMGDITLRQARQRVGRSLSFEGNLEVDDMLRASTGRIRELVATAIEDARGGGLTLCSTSGFMEWPVASSRLVNNYLAFISAGLEYGQNFS